MAKNKGVIPELPTYGYRRDYGVPQHPAVGRGVINPCSCYVAGNTFAQDIGIEPRTTCPRFDAETVTSAAIVVFLIIMRFTRTRTSDIVHPVCITVHVADRVRSFGSCNTSGCN